jgi:hypothetical protein
VQKGWNFKTKKIRMSDFFSCAVLAFLIHFTSRLRAVYWLRPLFSLSARYDQAWLVAAVRHSFKLLACLLLLDFALESR